MIKAKGTRVTAKAKNDNEEYKLYWDEDDHTLKFVDVFYELVDDQFAARHVIDYEKNSPEKIALVWAVLLEGVMQVVLDINILNDVCYDENFKYSSKLPELARRKKRAWTYHFKVTLAVIRQAKRLLYKEQDAFALHIKRQVLKCHYYMFHKHNLMPPEEELEQYQALRYIDFRQDFGKIKLRKG